MSGTECRCGLPEENHIPPRRHIPPAFGPVYANEDYHWQFCANDWMEPAFSWGQRPYGATLRNSPLFPDLQEPSLRQAHQLCNKACALFTVVDDPVSSSILLSRVYAAWFHHATTKTTRQRFLMERLEYSAIPEIRDTPRSDNIDRQTMSFIRAILPVHQTLCEIVEAKLDHITEIDKAADAWGEAQEGIDELQYGTKYTWETARTARYSILTHDHHRLRDEFVFEESFKRFFVFVDDAEIDSKGITLVYLGDSPQEGPGWRYDAVSMASWFRDAPGKVLEVFLALTGWPPSEHPEIMHGTKSASDWEP